MCTSAPIRRLVCSIWSRFFAMADKPVDPLTIPHLATFGAIVHTFARVELLIQAIMGRVVRLTGGDNVTVDMVILLTKPMTYAQKRDALLSCIDVFKLTDRTKTEITDLLNRAHKYHALRNHIAHSLWREGTRPTSVKPAFLDLRQGKGLIGGYEEDDRDYTLQELKDAADDLLATRSAMIQYLKLFDERQSWRDTPAEPDTPTGQA